MKKAHEGINSPLGDKPKNKISISLPPSRHVADLESDAQRREHIVGLREKEAESQRQLFEERAAKLSITIENLEYRLHEEQQQSDRLHKDLSREKTVVENLRRDLRARDRELDDRHQELSGKQTELDTVRADLNSSEDEREKTAAERELVEQERKSLEVKIERLRRNEEVRGSSVRGLEQELADARAEALKQKNRYDEVVRDNDELRSVVMTTISEVESGAFGGGGPATTVAGTMEPVVEGADEMAADEIADGANSARLQTLGPSSPLDGGGGPHQPPPPSLRHRANLAHVHKSGPSSRGASPVDVLSASGQLWPEPSVLRNSTGKANKVLQLGPSAGGSVSARGGRISARSSAVEERSSSAGGALPALHPEHQALKLAVERQRAVLDLVRAQLTSLQDERLRHVSEKEARDRQLHRAWAKQQALEKNARAHLDEETHAQIFAHGDLQAAMIVDDSAALAAKNADLQRVIAELEEKLLVKDIQTLDTKLGSKESGRGGGLQQGGTGGGSRFFLFCDGCGHG